MAYPHYPPPQRRASNAPIWILVAAFVGVPLLCIGSCVVLWFAGVFTAIANSNAPTP